MKALAVVFLVFVGCTGEATYNYPADCLTISSEIQLNPEAVGADAKLAREMLVDSEIIGSDKEFCATFKNTPILVSEKEEWDCQSSAETTTCSIGYYSILDGIKLSRSGGALVHELLHAWDAAHFRLGTSWHQNWKTNGYNVLDSQFMAGSLDMSKR